LQFILSIDKNLFIFLNRGMANPLFDVLMPIITNLDNWKIPIIIGWIFLIVKGGSRGRTAAFLLIPVLIIGDQLSASVLKPWIARLRPCHTLEHVRLLVNCGERYSFPSSHATNISGVAFLFSAIFRPYWRWFWLVAITVGFSRIYVGVHYPLDVLGGFVTGSLVAFMFYFLYLVIARKYSVINYNNQKRNGNLEKD